MKHFSSLLFIPVICLLLDGCGGDPQATQLASDVSTLHKIFVATLNQVNAMSLQLDEANDAATKQWNPNREKVIHQGDIDAYDTTFTGLEKYSTGIADLMSGGGSQSFDKSAESLAKNMNGLGSTLKLIPAKSTDFNIIAAGFTELGDIILKAYARSKAREVIKSTTPAVNGILADLDGNLSDVILVPMDAKIRIFNVTAAGNYPNSSLEDRNTLNQKFDDFKEQRVQLGAELQAISKALKKVKAANTALSNGDKRMLTSLLEELDKDVTNAVTAYKNIKS